MSIYVSPTGSDANAGTSPAEPVQTLQKAQTIVRSMNANMTGDITVYLESGTYRLSTPLTMGPSDSGTNGFNVTWTSAPGQTAIVSGAEQIKNWSESDPAKDMWSASVPKSLRTRQIYVDGVRAMLDSSSPPPHLGKWWEGYQTANDDMAHWRNPSEIDFAYPGQLGLMVETICPVAGIAGRLITMAQPCWENSNRRRNNFVGYGSLGLPGYIENAYELLTQPGQFYLDDHLHELYYIPRPGQDMHTADVEAPVLQTLIEGTGSPAGPIHNITFSGIEFEDATWLRPGTPEGFSEIQAGYTLTGPHGFSREGLCHFVPHGTCPYGAWTKEPGNIEFAYDRNISFVGDEFVHLGAAGLNLDNGSQGDTVEGCVFTDISGSGIELGSVNLPEAAPDAQTLNNTIANNHLYDLGIEYHGAIGILVGYAAETTIAHNQLDDLPYTGISMGWGGWPDKISRPSIANFSQNNVIEDNLIYDFVQTLSDGGGVYTLGLTGTSMANGEKIIGNEIYGQLNWSYALHSDDGATYVTNEDNVLFDNEYDWAGNHPDYQPGAGHGKHRPRDPQAVIGNYWQQGDPAYKDSTVTDRDNKVITGPSQAPAAIVDNVGIQAPYQSILSWQPAGAQVPNAPTKVSAVYSFQGSVYLNWLPSFADGDGPVVSYTVTTCQVVGAGCGSNGPAPLTIDEANYEQFGYAVIVGLIDGQKYTFSVTANSANGPSIPSTPSRVIIPTSTAPKTDDHVPGVYPRPGDGAASVIWYPPHDTLCPWWDDWCRRPVLAYKITVSDGASYMATGLSQLIVANHSGRALYMVPGLTPGHTYRFTVRPWNPSGFGPGMTSGPIKIGG